MLRCGDSLLAIGRFTPIINRGSLQPIPLRKRIPSQGGRRMQRKNILSILIFFATILIVAQSDNERNDARQKAQYARMQEMVNKTNQESFINISGSIVDEQGKPVNEVTVEIDFSRSKGWDNEHLNQKTLFNSFFSIKQSGYTGLTIDVQKRGYFPERRFFSTQIPSKYLKNNVLAKNDEKIVLRQIGKLAKLKNIDGMLAILKQMSRPYLIYQI